MSKCIRKMWGFQILHHHASLASSLNCLIKTCQIELNHMWGCLSFHVKYGTPLNFDLHQPSCHVIMHHIAHCTCIDLSYIYLVCVIWFFASRARVRAVRAGVRLHPRGGYRWFLYHWSDRRAHLLHLFCSFILVVLMLSLCCDSVGSCVLFHLFPDMSRVTLPLPIICCLLFASLASRSTCLGFCCYLDMLGILLGSWHMILSFG